MSMIKTLAQKTLSADIKLWKKKTSALFYSLMCVFSIIALFASLQDAPYDKKEFLSILFSISLIWLVSELLLIWFFYKSNVIPMYARSAFGFIIAFSNLWFLYFVLYKLSA